MRLAKTALAAIFSVSLVSGLSAAKWTEADFWTGSNNFLRTDVSFLANVSTRSVGGVNYSRYKIEGKDGVSSFRLPFSLFLGRNTMLTLKPFYYPKDKKGSSAWGGRAALSYLYLDEGKESSTNLMLSGAFEKQTLSEYAEEKTEGKSLEFQLEENFYDEFFILLTVSSFLAPENPPGAQKRYAEISDMISPQTFAFLNDTVYNSFGLQFARSLKPQYNSHAYAGAGRINCREADYNSYILGLRVDFLEKNFLNFSYNYLDSLGGRDTSYYKIGAGVFF